MALFGTKKNTKKVETETSEKKVVAKVPAVKKIASTTKTVAAVSSNVAGVLVRPRVTEKAANMTAVGVYTFDVRKEATKREVILAVKALYKVTPVKVNMVNTPAKRVKMRRKRGFGKTAATRKALVFLKKGETIRFS